MATRAYGLRIPLGIWRATVYELLYLRTTIGWHYHTLLVVLSHKPHRGWRLEAQKQARPLSSCEVRDDYAHTAN